MEISVSKFQNRVHVYGVEGGFPIFFDIDGRGTDIFPTGIIFFNYSFFKLQFGFWGVIVLSSMYRT